jgi:hypothetical protein
MLHASRIGSQVRADWGMDAEGYTQWGEVIADVLFACRSFLGAFAGLVCGLWKRMLTWGVKCEASAV